MKRHQGYGLLGLLVAVGFSTGCWVQQRLSDPAENDGIAVFPLSERADSSSPGAPQLSELTPEDRTAIAAVIQQQMSAFEADDAELAFGFASPNIQAQFQTAERFMAMVRTAYEPVYRPQSVDFGEVEQIDGNLLQPVTILGPNGEWTTAYYQMEQQPDASWRIAGCVLVPLEGEMI